jgi:hypothetical protein
MTNVTAKPLTGERAQFAQAARSSDELTGDWTLVQLRIVRFPVLPFGECPTK